MRTHLQAVHGQPDPGHAGAVGAGQDLHGAAEEAEPPGARRRPPPLPLPLPLRGGLLRRRRRLQQQLRQTLPRPGDPWRDARQSSDTILSPRSRSSPLNENTRFECP